MKAGTKYTYPRVVCLKCKKVVAANWIIRHGCSPVARRIMTLGYLIVKRKGAI